MLSITFAWAVCIACCGDLAERVRFKYPIAICKINSVYCRLLLDTGSNANYIHRKTLIHEKLGWAKMISSEDRYAASSNIRFGRTLIGSAVFLEAPEIYPNHLPSKYKRLFPCDGLIGCSFISNKKMQIDYINAAPLVSLEAHEIRGDKIEVRYSYDQSGYVNALIVQVRINSKKYSMLLDTGSYLSLIDSSIMKCEIVGKPTLTYYSLASEPVSVNRIKDTKVIVVKEVNGGTEIDGLCSGNLSFMDLARYDKEDVKCIGIIGARFMAMNKMHLDIDRRIIMTRK